MRKGTEPDPMLLSIVITTFNRAAVLAQLLKHFENQTDAGFEVVVAIDGSTDDTEEMLNTIGTSFPLRWVNTHCPGYGLAVARNQGILASRGQVVAIIDDDCFPCPSFVAAHKRSARPKTITGGPRTPASNDDVVQVQKMIELGRLPRNEPILLTDLRKHWPRAVATECNISLLREDAINLGLFSERLKLYGFIGQEFFARARHFGYMYRFDPETEIIHHRQQDGDNNLSLRKKARQIMIATAIRPSFMNPTQYTEQVEWATRMAAAYPDRCELPPFPASAVVAFPYRFLRGRLGALRRWVRSRRKQA